MVGDNLCEHYVRHWAYSITTPEDLPRRIEVFCALECFDRRSSDSSKKKMEETEDPIGGSAAVEGRRC